MGGRRFGGARSFIRSHRPFAGKKPKLPPGVVVGRHTYGWDEETFPIYTEGARIVVGAFCSIGPDARVHGGGKHTMTRPSTFPMNALLFDPERRNAIDDVDTGPTVIGNDVWIGMGATILAGVTIGDGAVIGAGAVVSKPVPPYAVVAGNPGRVVRYRFEEDVRDRLLSLRWWDWSDEQIRDLKRWFMGDAEAFLEEMERRGRMSAP
jgi:acetyltransferase-like isoleucine patch superfamily enzyme